MQDWRSGFRIPKNETPKAPPEASLCHSHIPENSRVVPFLAHEFNGSDSRMRNRVGMPTDADYYEPYSVGLQNRSYSRSST